MPLSAFFAKLRPLVMAVGVPLISHGFASPTLAGQQQQEGRQQRQSQQRQQSQQETSPPDSAALPPATDPSARPKPKKVWTNDDLISLRSPADIYLQEKEAQQSAAVDAAERKAELAKEMKDAGITLDLPSTADAAQHLIQEREDHLTDFQRRVDSLRRDLPDAAPEKKEVMQKELESFTKEVHETELELKVLRQHLEDLNKAKSAEPVLSSSSPPSEPKHE